MSSLNIGELTGFVGLNVNDLRASARLGERSINDLARRVQEEAQRIERQRMSVRLDGDASRAEQAIRDVQDRIRQLNAVNPVTAEVRADIEEAHAELIRLQHELARINHERVRIRIEADTQEADRARERAERLTRAMNTTAASFAALGGGVPIIAALGAALIAAAQAAMVLPAVLGAAAAAFATIKIGFGGIGDAISAMSSADSAGAGAASAAAAQREAAIERVRAATESLARAQEQANRNAITSAWQLADAQEAVAEAIERANEVAQSSARRIASAERAVADAVAAAADRIATAENSLARAQRSARDAQEALNDARKQAKEDLEDLALALSGAALDEEAAQLRLLRAQEALKRAGTNKNSLAWKEAELGVRQAEQALKEAQERYKDVKEEAAEANAKGVEGSDKVQKAIERVNDANQQAADAQAALDKARAQGARDVADAQERLAEVTAEAAKAQEKAAQDVEKAKRQLARTELQVAWAQADAAKSVADAQRQLEQALKDQEKAASGAAGGVDKYAEALAKLSPAGRELVKMLEELQPRWEELQRSIQQKLLVGVAKEIGELADIYFPILEAGLGRIASAFNSAFMDVSGLLKTKQASDDLALGLDNAGRATEIFGESLKPLTQIFLDLWAVGSEFLVGMAQGWTDGVKSFQQWISEARKSGELREIIQGALDVIKQLWQIVTNIGGAIGAIFTAGQEPGETFLGTLVNLTAKIKEFLQAPATQTALATFFQLLTDAGPALLALAAGLKIATTAQKIFNLVTNANPLMLIISLVIFLATLIITNWDTIKEHTLRIWEGIKDFFAGVWETVKEAFQKALDFIIDLFLNWTLPGLIIKHWDDIVAVFRGAWDTICGWVQSGVDFVADILSWFEGLPGRFRDWWDKATQWAIQKGAELLSWVAKLPGNILSSLGDLGSLLLNAGRDLINGLWSGISSMGSWLWTQITNFVKSFVPGPILQFLGIASPSKLMKKEVGRWIPAGIGEGVIENAAAASDAARMVAQDVAEQAQLGAAAGLAVTQGDIARLEAYANSTNHTIRSRAAGAVGAIPTQQAGQQGPRTVVNVHNPVPERTSESLNRKARSLEALGVL